MSRESLPPFVEGLKKDLERVDEEYLAHFANKSPSAQDPSGMDALILRTRDMFARIDQVPAAARGPELASLHQAVASRLSRYERERASIELVRRMSPPELAFAAQMAGVQMIAVRCGRCCSELEPSARDLAFLEELQTHLNNHLAELARIAENAMTPSFESGLQIARDTAKGLEREIQATRDARTAGTNEERSHRLLGLARAQFALHDAHFVGKAQPTRRPALLVRIIESLRLIGSEMRSLGVVDDESAEGLRLVDERAGAYDAELAEIKAARRAAPLVDLLKALAETSEEIVASYHREFAGKARTHVSAQRLGQLSDELSELLAQMVQFGGAHEMAEHEETLRMTARWLMVFEGEIQAIVRAQRQAVPSGGTDR